LRTGLQELNKSFNG